MTHTKQEMDAYYYSGLKTLVINMLDVYDISDESFEKAIDMSDDLEQAEDVYEALTGIYSLRHNPNTKYYMLHCDKWDCFPTFKDKDEAEEAREFHSTESLLENTDANFTIMEVLYER